MSRFGVGLALAALLTTVANAAMYIWVPEASNPVKSSGSLTYNGETVSSFSWQSGTAPADTTFIPPSAIGSVTVLADGDLELVGKSSGSSVGAPSITWSANAPSGFGEDLGTGMGGSAFYGDWVPAPAPVPEATTMIAAAVLLLMPVGASVRRILHKRRVS
jgi:hypothetical protein